ncbi:MAG: MBL fold metallo-hydrolase [Gemmatimonadota bacterium]|nr:MBL fold metallo-hydrolase [Gemmatimonadota bacterium]
MRRASHHAIGGGFRNPWPTAAPPSLGGIVTWALAHRTTRPAPIDPPRSAFQRAAPAFATPRATEDRLTITWVGHATFLVQVGGANVLTDPMWSDRASPWRWLGPRRWVAPGIALDKLPPVDAIVVSHDHYDHLDRATVRRLAASHPGAQWLGPLGVGARLRRFGAPDVRELDWWDEADAGPLRIACTPAQHVSGRGLRDRGRTLWCGWALRGGSRRVFFAGDSAYHPTFAEVAARHGPFDVALLPIGGYEPRWYMQYLHMSPEDAVRALVALAGGSRAAPPERQDTVGLVDEPHRSVATDINSSPGGPPKGNIASPRHRTVMIPMHWGTFKLTDEAMDEPPRRLRAAWADAELPVEQLRVLAHGETTEL